MFISIILPVVMLALWIFWEYCYEEDEEEDEDNRWAPAHTHTHTHTHTHILLQYKNDAMLRYIFEMSISLHG